MITSKQYPIKLILRILLFLAVSITLLFFTRLQYHNQTLHLVHISFTFILIAGFFYEKFNPIPNIRFYENKLIIKTLINKKTYHHTDIEKIEYFEREHWFHLLRKVYSTCIFLKNGDFIFIYDNWYKNYTTIEEHLKTIIISEKPKSTNNVIHYFKGSFTFSMSGIMFCLLTFVLLRSIDSSVFHNEVDIPFFIILVILLLMFSINIFIIGLSKDRMYIKNHSTFFLTKSYQLDDLINVRFEWHGKLTRIYLTRIRIWRKNIEWKRYYFFTLSNRTLRELAIVLKARGIQVIDDITF